MAKRTATSDLNHENWDAEEDPEEAGTFSKAADDVIKKRVIKVAKRRNPISSATSSEETKPNAFGGFTAFSRPTATEPSTIGMSSSTSSTSFGFLANLTNKKSEVELSKTNGNDDSKKPVDSDKNKSDEYYAKLKGLNESVAEWIKSHVARNPLVNLQPIFKDYEKFFRELEKSNESNKFSFGQPNLPTSTTSSTSLVPTFSFVATQNQNNNTPKFSFAVATTTLSTTSSTTSSTFSFGSANASKSSGGKFSFENNSAPTATSQSPATMGFCNTSSMINTSGGGAPSLSFGDCSATTSVFASNQQPKFSFGSGVTQPPSTEASKDEGNEDEPPKVEFTPVVEDGHVYTIRCKVFVKKEGAYGDRGVGNLYLKPVPDSDKYQLIVRADTNLGNLLCNFILSEGIPTRRMGKKDVMLVCLLTPETKPPPVPILLRVKTTEEADQLLETLEKYKK